MNKKNIIFQTNIIKTLYYNFKIFPFIKAIKMPLLIAKGTKIIKISKNSVKIICNCRTGIFRIGYNFVGTIDNYSDKTIIKIDDNAHIVLKGVFSLGCGSRMQLSKGAEFKVGNNVCVTARTSFICTNKIDIGDDVLISWDCLFMDSDLHNIKINGAIINETKPIIINNHVWIGARCTVLKGSFIPIDSVIGANSLITKKLEESSTLYAGNPVKNIKNNITWES